MRLWGSHTCSLDCACMDVGEWENCTLDMLCKGHQVCDSFLIAQNDPPFLIIGLTLAKAPHIVRMAIYSSLIEVGEYCIITGPFWKLGSRTQRSSSGLPVLRDRRAKVSPIEKTRTGCQLHEPYLDRNAGSVHRSHDGKPTELLDCLLPRSKHEAQVRPALE